MTPAAESRSRLRFSSIVALVATLAWVALVRAVSRQDRAPSRVFSNAGDARASDSTSKADAYADVSERMALEAVAPVPAENTALGTGGRCAALTICGIVMTSAGQPCPGASCRLYAGLPPQGMRFARGSQGSQTPNASCAADERGSFTLSAPAGYWTLLVEYPGLRSWREDAVSNGSYRHVVLERPRVLVLHVEDGEGTPVSGARLLLLEDPYSNPESARAEVLSDSAGRGEIELQPGGSWFVHASHPSYRTAVVAVPESDAARIERTVTLTRGIRIVGRVATGRSTERLRAEVLIDEWAPSPTRTLRCDAQGRFDSGPVFSPDAELELTATALGLSEVRKVVDLTAAAIVDDSCEVDFLLDAQEVRVIGRVATMDRRAPGPADVFLQPLGAGPFLEARKLNSPAVRWRAQASTATDGRFEIGRLMAHQGYQLLVVPREGFCNALARIPPLEPATVHDAGEIQVEPGGTLFGFARYADGSPVPHLHLTGIAIVSITWDQMKDPSYFPRRYAGRQDTYAAEDGRFELALLPGDTTYALYWGDGRMDEDRHVGEYSIRSGESIGPIEVIVPSAESGGGTRLSGTVSDEMRQPVESVLVEAWNGPATEVIGEGFRAGDLTDENGNFVLERLAPGRSYRITATDLRGRFARGEWTVPTADSGEPLELELEWSGNAPRRVEGTVTDADGRPLEGIQLTLYLSPLLVRCDCMSWQQRTDELGAFSFGAVTDGVHQVGALDPQGRYRASLLDVRPGSDVAIVME